MSDFTLSFGDGDLPSLSFDDPWGTPEPSRAPAQAADVGLPASAEEAEQDIMADVSDILTGFRARASREDQRVVDAVDTEYWFCLCFQTRQQKDEFLLKMGWADIGNKYLDGMLVAEVQGINLESRVPALPQQKAGDSRLNALAQEPIPLS